MAIEIRPITESEVEQYSEVTSAAFGSHTRPESVAFTREHLAEYETLAAFDDGVLIATAGIEPFDLGLPGGRTAPVAGVTRVAVRPTHRRRGILSAMMRRQLDDVRASGRPFAALWASESLIYGRFGYGLAIPQENWRIDRRHTAMVVEPSASGHVRIIDAAEARQVLPDLYGRVGAARPGWMPRRALEWAAFFRDSDAEPAKAPFIALYEVDGRPEGYTVYRIDPRWPDSIPQSELTVEELAATDAEAEAALWSFIFGIDLIGEIVAQNRPTDDPLPWRLRDTRRLHRSTMDAIWLRLVDVPAALEARGYPSDGALTLEVADPFCPWNAGRYRLEAAEGGARCTPTDTTADLALDVTALAACYLGAVRPSVLAAAGRIEERTSGAVRVADRLFATERAPWCRTFF